MLRISLIVAVTLACLPFADAHAAPSSGTYAVSVPSRHPFVATVSVVDGRVTGFTMERNEIVSYSAQVTAKNIVIDAEFLGACGQGSAGQMTIGISGDKLFFKRWKGLCASRGAKFNVRRKLKMIKQ